jgi:hypothetical protein
MKKSKILLGLLIAYALNSCSLFSDPEPELPPATQIGANTLGFKVNGKNWVPKNDTKFPPNTPENIKLAVSSGLTDYNLLFIDGKRVDIKGEKDSFFSIELYNFDGTTNYSPIAMSYSQTNVGSWSAVKNKPWKINITKLDTVNYICAGTFSFTGVDSQGGTVAITDGRFDVKYK